MCVFLCESWILNMFGKEQEVREFKRWKHFCFQAYKPSYVQEFLWGWGWTSGEEEKDLGSRVLEEAGGGRQEVGFVFFLFWPNLGARGILVPLSSHRGWTCAPCIGSVAAWSPNLWTSREVPAAGFFVFLNFFSWTGLGVDTDSWSSTFRKLRSWHLVPSLHGK